MAHCHGGVALDDFDLLTALTNWVEKGTAPDSVVATGHFRATAARFAPIPNTPNTQYAQYTGQGDPEDAKNFVCRE